MGLPAAGVEGASLTTAHIIVANAARRLRMQAHAIAHLLSVMTLQIFVLFPFACRLSLKAKKSLSVADECL